MFRRSFSTALITLVGLSSGTLASTYDLSEGQQVTGYPYVWNQGYFGASVAVDGNWAVIGGYFGESLQQGGAYVFTDLGGNGWELHSRLLPDGLANRDYFGRDVAIDGTTIVVGAYGDDNSKGRVYIFDLDDETNSWVQTADVVADDRANSDFFGTSIAIADDVLVVGATGNDDQGSNSGSAYVFEINGNDGWVQRQKLLSPTGGLRGYFGISCAVIDGRAAVGAFRSSENGSNAGSVHIYDKPENGIAWIHAQTVVSTDIQAGDYFGVSVDLDTDGTLAVGGSYAGTGGTNGAAYIFEAGSDGQYTQTAKVESDNATYYSFFGDSVALSGNVLVVGALNDGDYYSLQPGAAHIFSGNDSGDSWTEVAKLGGMENLTTADGFGKHVAVSDTTILVGAWQGDVEDPFNPEEVNTNAGYAVFYEILQEEPGPCCFPNGGCTEKLLASECTSLGGTPGSGTCATAACETYCNHDIDENGVTDVEDLLLFLDGYGATCP